MAIFKDELFEAQWLRAAGHASYDAAEIAECLEVARQIGGADPERWFAAWSGFASRLFEAAEHSELAGHSASARGAYLRASNYWRAAWTFLVPGADRGAGARRLPPPPRGLHPSRKADVPCRRGDPHSLRRQVFARLFLQGGRRWRCRARP